MVSSCPLPHSLQHISKQELFQTTLPMRGGRRRRVSGISKRRRKEAKTVSSLSIMDSLPNDMIVQVLARVATFSVSDLANAKLSCKTFHELAEDDCVYELVSLHPFPPHSWCLSKQALSFWDKCREKGNSEALFQQGVIDYFSHTKMDSGLQLLKRAAESGHNAATYTVAIILLSYGSSDENKQEGMKLFSRTRKGKSRRECRKKLKTILESVWLNNKLLLDHIPEYYCKMREQHRRRKGWPVYSDDDEDFVDCEACDRDHEVVNLRKWLGN